MRAYYRTYIVLALILVCSSFHDAVSADDVAAGSSKPQPSTTAASTNKPISIVAPAAASNEVVARVNGADINRKELDAAVKMLTAEMARQGRPIPPSQGAALEQDVLDKLIGRELLLQEARKHIPADIDQKVQEQIDRVKAQVGGDEEFKKKLADSGITPADYTQRVRENIIVREAVGKEDIRAYVARLRKAAKIEVLLPPAPSVPIFPTSPLPTPAK
jgi:hypothetical protein